MCICQVHQHRKLPSRQNPKLRSSRQQDNADHDGSAGKFLRHLSVPSNTKTTISSQAGQRVLERNQGTRSALAHIQHVIDHRAVAEIVDPFWNTVRGICCAMVTASMRSPAKLLSTKRLISGLPTEDWGQSCDERHVFGRASRLAGCRTQSCIAVMFKVNLLIVLSN